MIGSLMSRMGMAEKLSVAQLQQAIQDGTLPAYVGIPLLQDKMQQEKAARAAAMGVAPQGQPPIAQQVMQEAQAQEAQGIDAAPSNMPENFAGGGIVAFADGGMLDEDDAEDEDKALFSRLLGGISMPKSYEAALAEKGYTPQGLRDLVRKVRKDDLGNYVAPAEGAVDKVVGRKLSMQGHPYHEQTVMYAKKLGVDPDEALKLLYTETGGVKDPARAKSKAGAYGPLQLMEGTAKELGVNRKNPLDNIRGGLEYYKQQREIFGDPKLAAAAYNAGPGAVRRALKQGYGIDALPMETRQYAANFAGGGIVAFADGGLSVNDLLNAEYGYPNETERALAEEYGPKGKSATAAPKVPKGPSKEATEFLERQAARKAPTSAASAAAEAPGLVSRLNKLIGAYAVPAGVYEGGKALGSSTMDTMAGNPYFENYSDPFMGDVAVGNAILNQNQGALNMARQPAPTAAAPAPAAPTQTVSDITKSPFKGDQFQIDYSNMDKYSLGNKTAPEEKVDDGLGDIRSMIKESIAESKRQKEIDNWMSLLSGAVGTLKAANTIEPGKVHTALGDIGTGAQQGIGYYAQAAKQRADENKGLLAAQLGLSRAELYEKLRRDALTQKAAETKYAQGIKGRQLDLQGQALRVKQGELMRKAATDWENSQDKADIIKDLARQNKNWQQDPKLLGEYNLKKNRFVKQFMSGEQADDVLSASDLLS